VAGLLEQLAGPAGAVDLDAPRQARPLEADRVAEDLRARQLRAAGVLGQRGGRLLEVGAVELDPATPGPHEGTSLGGQLGDVRRRQLHVVEHG
jgi:hypothetical protein